MSYSLQFSSSAKDVIRKWKRDNLNAYKKVCKILEELMDHPRIGTGHPEPLRGGHDITWSRRVTANDRIIYDIYDETIEVHIVHVGGHYDDK